MNRKIPTPRKGKRPDPSLDPLMRAPSPAEIEPNQMLLPLKGGRSGTPERNIGEKSPRNESR